MRIKNFILIFCCILLSSISTHAEEILIHYFNPDNPYQGSELIDESNKYFKKTKVTLSIQPVVQVKYLKQLLSEQKIHFMIVSPLLKEALEKKSNTIIESIISPILHNDKSEYSKTYISKEGVKLEYVKGASIAIASNDVINDKLINEYLFENTNFNSNDVDIIWVKNDLDAIMAVRFEQVEAAIVSPISLKTFKEKRPYFIKGINSIGITKPIPAPQVYVVNYAGKMTMSEIIRKIKSTFSEMNNNKLSSNLLEVLGVKRWLESKE